MSNNPQQTTTGGLQPQGFSSSSSSSLPTPSTSSKADMRPISTPPVNVLNQGNQGSKQGVGLRTAPSSHQSFVTPSLPFQQPLHQQSIFAHQPQIYTSTGYYNPGNYPPSANFGYPLSNFGQPLSNFEQPWSNFGQPLCTFRQPLTNSGQSVANFVQPAVPINTQSSTMIPCSNPPGYFTPVSHADRINRQNSSRPSLANQTPQPLTFNDKKIQEIFAKQVLEAINSDSPVLKDDSDNHSVHSHHEQDPTRDQIIDQNTHSPPLSLQSTAQNPFIVQFSNCSVNTIQFILPSSNKETPISSTKCDGTEMTVSINLPKNSPGTKIKREQQQSVKEHYETVKKQTPIAKDDDTNEQQSTPSKEVDNKKDSSAVSETKYKQQVNTIQFILPSTTNKETSNASTNCDATELTLPSNLPKDNPDTGIKKEQQQSVKRRHEPAKKWTHIAKDVDSKEQQSTPLEEVDASAVAKTKNKQHVNTIQFILPSTTNKETSIASTNCDASELTLPSNLPKDNPDTGIKKEQQQSVIEYHEPVKKQTPIAKDVDTNEQQSTLPKELDSDKDSLAMTNAKNKQQPAVEKPLGPPAVFDSWNILYPTDVKSSVQPMGQWSPENQTGSKIYSKDFLIALRDAASSKLKPENIPDVLLANVKEELCGSLFGKSSDKSGSLDGTGVLRYISHSRMTPSKGSKSTTSGQKNVTLYEAKSTWRPKFNKDEFTKDDTEETEELYKKIRGIFKKLTPQNVVTLLAQNKALKITTATQLQFVLDLFFKKAADEPNSSVPYALMCKKLSFMHVPNEMSTEEKPDNINFRKLLVAKCDEYENKQHLDESVRNSILKDIQECTDPKKKEDLELNLEEYNRELIMKKVRSFRFIGELFIEGMISPSSIFKLLSNVLDNKDEESLECVCTLLNTIGKELEEHFNLTPMFTQVQDLIDKKEETKISNRILSMLQDLIDLRNSKWGSKIQPTNTDVNVAIGNTDWEECSLDVKNSKGSPIRPKKNQMLNFIQITPRKEYRMKGLGNTNTDRKRQGGRSVSDNEGWITSSSNRGRTPFSVQSDKLKSKAPTIDEPLGSPAMFGSWGKGAAMGVTAPPQPVGTNVYASLENLDTEKRTLGVALKELVSFFTLLRENDDEESSEDDYCYF